MLLDALSAVVDVSAAEPWLLLVSMASTTVGVGPGASGRALGNRVLLEEVESENAGVGRTDRPIVRSSRRVSTGSRRGTQFHGVFRLLVGVCDLKPNIFLYRARYNNITSRI